MKIGSTIIDDSFAEAFSMRYTRLLVTAFDDYWLDAAIGEFAGYSASVIACDTEIGVEHRLAANDTPDGRVGASLMAFGFSVDALAKAIPVRVGQCLMTCPTTAVFDGLGDAGKRIPIGSQLRYFGDGFQKSKVLFGKRFWRIPVMDGEFVVQEDAGVEKGIAGGNILIHAKDQAGGLQASRRAVEAVVACSGVIAPFPGGVVRSGSKVGSRYASVKASTADAYCPTLRGRVESKIPPGANCVYEIVIDGESEPAVQTAMKAMVHAAAGEEVVAIGAGNYGGKLGKFHFHLRDLL